MHFHKFSLQWENWFQHNAWRGVCWRSLDLLGSALPSRRSRMRSSRPLEHAQRSAVSPCLSWSSIAPKGLSSSVSMRRRIPSTTSREIVPSLHCSARDMSPNSGEEKIQCLCIFMIQDCYCGRGPLWLDITRKPRFYLWWKTVQVWLVQFKSTLRIVDFGTMGLVWPFSAQLVKSPSESGVHWSGGNLCQRWRFLYVVSIESWRNQ